MERELITVLCLLLLGLKPSCEGRLLENDLFIAPGNPSAYDPNLNSVVATFNHPLQKAGIGCDQGGPATNAKEWVLKFKENRTGVDEKKGGLVYMNGERLSTSKSSPVVGHMQIFNDSKARQSEQQEEEGVSEKRILKSTPSRGGDGH